MVIFLLQPTLAGYLRDDHLHKTIYTLHILKCPEPLNRLYETIKFSEYSNISFAAERKILNKFAEGIIRYTSKDYASAQAYIVVHPDRRGRQLEATARAKRAKQYLVKVRHINPDRIVILNAGDREKLTIELYLLPPGAKLRLSVIRQSPRRNMAKAIIER